MTLRWVIEMMLANPSTQSYSMLQVLLPLFVKTDPTFFDARFVDVFTSAIAKESKNIATKDVKLQQILQTKLWGKVGRSFSREEMHWSWFLFDFLVTKGCIEFLEISIKFETEFNTNFANANGKRSIWPKNCEEWKKSAPALALVCDDIEVVRRTLRWSSSEIDIPISFRDGKIDDESLFRFLYWNLGSLYRSPDLLEWVLDFGKAHPDLEQNSTFDVNSTANIDFFTSGKALFTANAKATRLFLENRAALRVNGGKPVGALLRNCLITAVNKLDIELFDTFREFGMKLLSNDIYYLMLRQRFCATDYTRTLPKPSFFAPTVRRRFSDFMIHVLQTTPNFLDNILPMSSDNKFALVEHWMLYGSKELFQVLVSENVPIDPDCLLSVFRTMEHYSFFDNDLPGDWIDDNIFRFLTKSGFKVTEPATFALTLCSNRFLTNFTASVLLLPNFKEIFAIVSELLGDEVHMLQWDDTFDHLIVQMLQSPQQYCRMVHLSDFMDHVRLLRDMNLKWHPGSYFRRSFELLPYRDYYHTQLDEFMREMGSTGNLISPNYDIDPDEWS